MKPTLTLAATLVVLATLGYAHTGVQNPAVMARMDGMKAIGDAMKTISAMAKGEVAFDAATARAAAAQVARHAAQTPDLFEAEETDPKSEALPAIWDNFADFTAKAQDTERAALTVAQNLDTAADLTPALTSIGVTCKACHSDYRK